MSSKELGIKESLEVIKGVELVGINVAGAFSDGKLNMRDIQFGLALAKESQVLVDAVKDIKLVGDEVKDLSQEELLQLGMAAFAMVKKISAASKASK